MSLAAIILTASAVAKIIEPGCAVEPSYKDYVDACITEEKAGNIADYCYSFPCKFKPVHLESDTCFKQFGICNRVGSSCEWQMSKKLLDCLDRFRPKTNKPLN